MKKKNLSFNNKSTLALTLLFMLLMIFVPSQAFALNPKSIFNTDFHAKIENYMNQTCTKSCVLSVINGDEPFYSHGYGEQPELDKIYKIGSITKTFTATAILKLQEQRLLSIEDPINDYLPFIVRHPDYPEVQIKIKHLLSHQSGIIDPYNYLGYIRCSYNLSISQILYNFLNVNGSEFHISRFFYQAGTNFTYSNIGYDLLAYIAELTSGVNYAEYLSDNILEPLGMIDTKLDYHDYDQSRLINLYSANMFNITMPAGYYNFDGRGCGGLHTTISDLERLAIMHINNGTYKGSQILNETSINLMHEKHVKITELDYMDYYGFGWYHYNGSQGHSGGSPPGGTAQMFFKEGVGVIYFLNQFQLEDGPIYVEMLEYIWDVAYSGILETTYINSLILIVLMSPVILLIRRRRKHII